MPESKSRILLVDDHDLFREGVVRLIGGEPDFEIAGHCATIQEAWMILDSTSVDVILLDVDLGGDRASGLLMQCRQKGLQTRVMLLTAGVASREWEQLKRLGVDGIFIKDRRPQELTEAIRQIVRGRGWIDARYAATVENMVEAKTGRLSYTAREQEVIRAVFEGLTNKEIASRLGVSESSVKGTMQQLFEKTGVRSRGQLVKFALERELDRI